MSSPKTQPTNASVEAFINAATVGEQREDAYTLLALFSRVTGEKPVMWGPSMIGFGTYRYQSERSSQHGDWFITGFAPRKQSLSLYVLSGFEDQTDLLEKLGPHKTGVGCLYIKRLKDIDIATLEQIIRHTDTVMRQKHEVIS